MRKKVISRDVVQKNNVPIANISFMALKIVMYLPLYSWLPGTLVFCFGGETTDSRMHLHVVGVIKADIRIVIVLLEAARPVVSKLTDDMNVVQKSLSL